MSGTTKQGFFLYQFLSLHTPFLSVSLKINSKKKARPEGRVAALWLQPFRPWGVPAPSAETSYWPHRHHGSASLPGTPLTCPEPSAETLCLLPQLLLSWCLLEARNEVFSWENPETGQPEVSELGERQGPWLCATSEAWLRPGTMRRGVTRSEEHRVQQVELGATGMWGRAHSPRA